MLASLNPGSILLSDSALANRPGDARAPGGPRSFNWSPQSIISSLFSGEEQRTERFAARARSELFGKFGRVDQLRSEVARCESDAEAECLRIVCHHCIDVIDTTASFLTKSLDAQVALSLKLLWTALDGGKPVVRTLFRSTLTKDVREKFTPPDLFAYDEHTAFEEIAKSQGQDLYFGCNDLLDLNARGLYKNKNARWSSFYTATSVYGIPASYNPDNGLLGFLCADAMYDRLNTPSVRRVLGIVSDHLYSVLGVVTSVVGWRAGAQTAPVNPSSILAGAGWRLDAHKALAGIEPSAQEAFQKSIVQLQHLYRTDIEFNRGGQIVPSPRASGFHLLPSSEEGRSMDQNNYDDLDVVYVTEEAKRTHEAMKKLRIQPEASYADALKILGELAQDDPYAAELLRGLKANGNSVDWPQS